MVDIWVVMIMTAWNKVVEGDSVRDLEKWHRVVGVRDRGRGGEGKAGSQGDKEAQERKKKMESTIILWHGRSYCNFESDSSQAVRSWFDGNGVSLVLSSRKR